MPAILPSPPRNASFAADLGNGNGAKPKTTWPINRDIQARFLAYRDRTDKPNKALGRELGFPDGTVVSKYLNSNGDLDRNPVDIERKIVDLLAARDREILVSGHTVNTSVITRAANFFTDVERSKTVGVLHGPAGIGKSVAVATYAAEHPRCVVITANAAQCDARGVQQLLWAQSDHGIKPSQSRWEFLVSKFRGSGRLLIVDNAQRLDGTGRDYLFDFRDATGLPIALVGNPCILQRVAGSDQQHSRTMKETEVKLDRLAAVSREIVDAHTTHGAAIYDLAEGVVKRKGGGHLRALVGLLTSMEIFLEDPRFDGDARAAFESAMATNIHHKH